jgi:hypothetical protein
VYQELCQLQELEKSFRLHNLQCSNFQKRSEIYTFAILFFWFRFVEPPTWMIIPSLLRAFELSRFLASSRSRFLALYFSLFLDFSISRFLYLSILISYISLFLTFSLPHFVYSSYLVAHVSAIRMTRNELHQSVYGLITLVEWATVRYEDRGECLGCLLRYLF